MTDMLQAGKLPPALLERVVIGRKGLRRPEVLVPAALGEDAAVIDCGDDLCVLAVDPITGAGSEVGWLAVHISSNDVAAHGGTPVAVLLTILLPEGSELRVLEELMAGAERAASEVGVEIAGGHTEVTPGLPRPLVTATVIGRAPRGRLLRSSDLNPGDLIWMSKTAGIEGTAILATDMRDELAATPAAEVLDAAVALVEQISVVPEALAAAKAGATAMHDVTEGGVLGALWEMAAAAGTGLEVWPDRIPIAPATARVCAALEADPLRLISSGVLLAAAPATIDLSTVTGDDNTEFKFTAIARALPPGAGCWLSAAGSRQPLSPPESDELWRIKSAFGS